MNSKIYVSLTSIPPRQKHLPSIIESLLKNSVLPEKIIINICKTYDRYPNQIFDLSLLEKYKNNKLIKINLVDNDDGPITKIFGYLDELLKLEDLDNKYILTADDDLLYKPNFIEAFINKNKLDRDCIFTGYKENRGNKFATCFGADGILIKLSYLHKIKEYASFLIDKEIKFKYHDDFILSSYFYLNNIKTCLVDNCSRYNNKESNYSANDEYSLTQYELGCNDNIRGEREKRDQLLYIIFFENKNNSNLDKYLIN